MGVCRCDNTPVISEREVMQANRGTLDAQAFVPAMPMNSTDSHDHEHEHEGESLGSQAAQMGNKSNDDTSIVPMLRTLSLSALGLMLLV